MTQGAELDVSRETLQKLRDFAALVEKWTARINLVSKSNSADIWQRHIVDSAQLYRLAPKSGRWVDLGSGGGFPGIVVAILTQEAGPAHDVMLIESDQRKCAFLRAAIRELGLDAMVIAERVENVAPLGADVLSARALAGLPALLGFAERHLKPGGTALFPKGATWQKEHDDAQQMWSYTCEAIMSETNQSAAILKIKDVVRV